MDMVVLVEVEEESVRPCVCDVCVGAVVNTQPDCSCVDVGLDGC